MRWKRASPASEGEKLAEQPAAGIRTFWSGAITFGLVSVPVALFPATRARAVRLRMVDEGGAPLQRHYVCSKDGKDLDWDDIVRGYEIETGKFVIVTDDELEAIEPRKTREIDLQLFVKEDEIDPMFYERAYYLVPTGGTNKAYRLLASAMEESGRAGIATFVMRGKEYLVAIIAENGILRAETLRFADEIRKPADVGLPKKAKAKPAAVRKFTSAISTHSGKLNLREFLDRDAEKLEKLAQAKEARGKDVVRDRGGDEAASDDDDSGGGGEVVDILKVLQQSLRGEAPAKKRKAPQRAARSKKPAKRPAKPAKRARSASRK